MKKLVRTLAVTAIALTLGAGTAHASTRNWTVCGGNAFNTCASVQLTVVGQTVRIRVWNLSGFHGSYANTVFTAVGFENIGSGVAAVGGTTMTGPVRAGNTPGSWTVTNNKQVGGGVKLDVVTRSGNVNNSIASGCANAAMLPGGSNQLWQNPCALPTGASDPGYVEITFNVTGTWDVDNSWLLVKGQNGVNGQSTECMTGGNDVNCITATVNPEPVTMVLLGSGLAGMGGFGFLRRRKDKNAV